MRTVTILILCFFYSAIHAEQFTIFEKDGLFGVKDESGEVTVPPVYEKLGWSDGSTDIHSGTIGFREGRLWGLITVRNKPLTEKKFYSMVPFSGKLIKASVKGKFSNQLFYGLLTSQGKVEVSFNYFSLEKTGVHLMVSYYEGRTQQFGIISKKNELIIPVKYREIKSHTNLFFAEKADRTLDIFDLRGNLLLNSIDSAEKMGAGYKVLKEGYTGLITNDGLMEEQFENKDIIMTNDEVIRVPFPKWEVYENDELILEVKADSVDRNKRGYWMAYRNRSHHFALSDSMFFNSSVVLKDITDHSYVIKNVKTDQWSVITKVGDEILIGRDSIYSSTYGFWALLDGLWTLHNRYGKKRGRFGFQKMQEGIGVQYIVKLNGSWGLVDGLGKEVTRFKYDSIVKDGLYYRVKYLDKWGVMDKKGSWIVRSEYAQIFIYNHVFVGRLGLGYTYFSRENSYKSISRPLCQVDDFLIIEDDEGAKGIIRDDLEIITYPEYKSITKWGDFFELYDGEFVSLISEAGTQVFGPEEGIESILGLSEDYFLVKKNGKYGFLDKKGRLRISNRYEEAQPFHDGLAAIKLRDKWGFIDKEEAIVIQPYYSSVEPFHLELSIVQKSNKFGLINKSGEEVVGIRWKNIERLESGNYKVEDEAGKLGLISDLGQFILRPSFDELEDSYGKVIVTQNGRQGILDYAGNQLFKVSFKEIRISDDFTLLKY